MTAKVLIGGICEQDTDLFLLEECRTDVDELGLEDGFDLALDLVEFLIGVAVSMFTAVSVSRTFLSAISKNK